MAVNPTFFGCQVLELFREGAALEAGWGLQGKG